MITLVIILFGMVLLGAGVAILFPDDPTNHTQYQPNSGIPHGSAGIPHGSAGIPHGTRVK